MLSRGRPRWRAHFTAEWSGAETYGDSAYKMPGTVSVLPQVPSVCMEAGAGDLIWNPHQLYLKLQHKSPDLNHWVQLLKQSLDNIFCTEHSRNCLTKERNGSLWYKKLPPFSVFLEVVLLRMVCTWLLGLQDLSAEHHHFMHVFPEDSEQKGLFFLNLCSWCWCYFVLIVW